MLYYIIICSSPWNLFYKTFSHITYKCFPHIFNCLPHRAMLSQVAKGVGPEQLQLKATPQHNSFL